MRPKTKHQMLHITQIKKPKIIKRINLQNVQIYKMSKFTKLQSVQIFKVSKDTKCPKLKNVQSNKMS